MSQPQTIVKVLSKGQAEIGARLWPRQVQPDSGRENTIRFTFDADERKYDWLVVYDDLPAADGERFACSQEILACRPDRTILVTAEPSSIKLYSADFCRQFGWVFSSQEPWAIRHPRHHYRQVGLRWFYGHGTNHTKSFHEIESRVPLDKSEIISCVCSSKAHIHTLHAQRIRFVKALKAQLPELSVFGHGVRPINDKSEALDSYRYHIAIENHCSPHHWTEKLSDAFLGATLPFYYGAPNAAEYFPADSFIAIDIRKPEQAGEIIRAAIKNNEYERRRPAILEARRRVLHEHQLFAQLKTFVESHTSKTGDLRPQTKHTDAPERIVSRRAARAGFLRSMRHFREQVAVRTRNAVQRLVPAGTEYKPPADARSAATRAASNLGIPHSSTDDDQAKAA